MAAIDDLIAQIEDKALRERLRMETDRITKEKKFGLVFEEHLPELTPIYNAKVRKGSVVMRRGEPLSDLWRVLSINGSEAHCLKRGSDEKRQISVDELTVVAQFGEPIFPALVPVDRVQNGPDDAPWHTLIEADNYHALQLLEYLYAGQVDCIYIDPPFNTGARDWKYNNDYVDANDRWRHSKWLAMMHRRLVLAKNLLRYDGVLIITIDDCEFSHLECLLEDLFSGYWRYLIAIEHNKRGRRGKNFAKSNEFAIFLVREGEEPISEEPIEGIGGERRNLRRTGSGSLRAQRWRKFYPIYIDIESEEILEIGNSLPLEQKPFSRPPKEVLKKYPGRKIDVVWPLDEEAREKNWHYAIPRAQSEHKQGKLALKEQAYGWQVYYSLREKDSKKYKTVWTGSHLDASTHGTEFLEKVLGVGKTFDFPKSVYAVNQCLMAATLERPNALILDFFAGSGTTLNAVNLLNESFGGKRRCILVTNNEVSEEEAKILSRNGHQPDDKVWEENGICQFVTWPRSKFTILGKRDDGKELEGEYPTGKSIEKEKTRKFLQVSFTTIDDLNTTAKKKQLVALIGDIPQSEVKTDSAFVVSDKHPASILFDESHVDAWLEALEEQDHITDFYIVTAKKVIFDNIKAQINNQLGPVIVTEEEMHPMREGFAANLEYFRLDFLDKNHVALGRQFREILPILWLRAGAIGPRPELPKNKPIPAMVLPKNNPFAVLVDETHFADFLTALETKEGVTHVYLVTDSEEAFQEMAAQLSVPHVVQLYRDYLENFVINKGDNAK